MCQTLCQVAWYTLSDLVFMTTFMTKTALVSSILKWRKLKVSLVASMPASSPMYCCWRPWKFIYHLWAIERIGEEAVAQSRQEHLGLWRRTALLGCLRPLLSSEMGPCVVGGEGGRGQRSPEDLAVGSHLPRFVSMASELDWHIPPQESALTG